MNCSTPNSTCSSIRQQIWPILASDSATLFIAPRRFGKSTLLQLRRAYLELPNEQALKLFEHGGGDNELAAAKDLRAAIAAGRKPVPVINLNLAVPAVGPASDMHGAINNALLQQADLLNVSLEAKPECHLTLFNLIFCLCRNGTPPAVQIDELDYCLVESMRTNEPKELHDDRVSIIGSLFSVLKQSLSAGYIHSIFAVGITHLRWPSISTPTNNLQLVSYDEAALRPQVGYTWAQIEKHFKGHIDAYVTANTDANASPEAKEQAKQQLRQDLTKMYDGYRFNRLDKEAFFNPWSINNFFLDGTLTDHWGQSVAAQWLGGKVEADLVEQFVQADLGRASSLDLYSLPVSYPFDNLPPATQRALLVQCGELTIQEGTGNAKVPNEELRLSVLPALLMRLYRIDLDQLISIETARLLQECQVQEFFDRIVASRQQLPTDNFKDTSRSYKEYPLPGVISTIIHQLARKIPDKLRIRGFVRTEAQAAERRGQHGRNTETRPPQMSGCGCSLATIGGFPTEPGHSACLEVQDRHRGARSGRLGPTRRLHEETTGDQHRGQSATETNLGLGGGVLPLGNALR